MALWSPLCATLLAASTNPYDNLPACCRRDGKHHCMLGMMGGSSIFRGDYVSSPTPHCPFFPKDVAPITNQGHLLTLLPDRTLYAGLRSHPALFAQIEARYRISFDRSRQKRGPPSLL